MSSPEQPAKASTWRACLLAFVFFLAVVVMIAKFVGWSNLGSEPDEAAHYVTGLMVADYARHGFPAHPMQFARDYYEHYPKVGLGHWPPMFYIAEALWMFTHLTVRFFMAVIAAGAATLLFTFLRPKFGLWKAVAGTLLFLCVPLVQQFASSVMTEIPMTLLLLAAAFYWARFLQNERARDAVLFGVMASVAILVKFSGFSLALVPLFSLVITRRFYLLKKRTFWIPAMIVAVLTLPWTIATLKLAQEGMAGESFGWSFTHLAIPFYSNELAHLCGVTILLAALLGLAFTLARRSRLTPADASLGALLLSVVIFHMFVPTGFEARHLIPCVPALIYFAWLGADWIAVEMASPKMPLSRTNGLVFGFIGFVFLATTFHIPKSQNSGFADAADFVVRNCSTNSPVLVASDARGEGMLIAGVASLDHDKRPAHYVQRASKKLAVSGWSGGGYHLMYCKKMSDKTGSEYSTADQLAMLLQQDTIKYVIIDESVLKEYQTEHWKILRAAIEQHPNDFLLTRSIDVIRANTQHPKGLRIYYVNR